LKSSELNPYNVDTLFTLGNLFKKMGQRKEAIANYSKAANLDTDNFYASFNIGILYQEMGQYKEAVEYYLKANKAN
jgi:tetratricopeptide (TPR) repeat protein